MHPLTVNYAGESLYSRAMLNREAKIAARAHSLENGGGRAFGIEWELAIHKNGTVRLVVAYACNRPDGNCGIYRLSVAL